MALLSRFFGRTASEGAAFALGTATGPVLSPAVEDLKNEAWRTHPSRTVGPNDAAEIVAEDVEARDWGAGEAAAHGVNGDRFDALVNAVRNAPGIGELMAARRRGTISDSDFEHGLRKARLEGRWDDALRNLLGNRLDPAVIALAIVRGIMEDPGFLPVGPPATEGRVRAFPTSPLDALEEARAAGIDRARLFVETAIAGRPMGPEAAAAAVFRDILERVDYDRAIAEGDVRNEWADAIFETARQIPSVADYVNAHIRGWITQAEMHTGAARHGMSADDVDLLYLRTGRPAAPGQMATAAARGIDGPDGRPMDRAQFLKGIAESDIRPEWGPMLWDARFLYPPLFQLTRLVQAGAITADTARDWARKDRYPPEVVDALHAYWTQPAAATAENPRAKLATTQAVAALKKRFLIERIDAGGVLAGLELLGESPADAGHILEMWTLERGWLIKPLTGSQIKKDYREGKVSLDEAIAELERLHYNATEAERFLTQ